MSSLNYNQNKKNKSDNISDILDERLPFKSLNKPKNNVLDEVQSSKPLIKTKNDILDQRVSLNPTSQKKFTLGSLRNIFKKDAKVTGKANDNEEFYKIGGKKNKKTKKHRSRKNRTKRRKHV